MLFGVRENHVVQVLSARMWQKKVRPKPFENQCFRDGKKTKSYGERKTLQTHWFYKGSLPMEGWRQGKVTCFYSFTPPKNR